MHLFNRTLLMLAVMVLGVGSLPAYGEFYQYTDSNGVMRFTDDFATVPSDQRPDVTTHESVKSAPVQPAQHFQNTGKKSLTTMASSGDASLQTGTWHEKIDSQTKELDRIQTELSKTYQSLQAERQALAAKAPPASASADARAAYRRQVDQLNKKIADYEAQYAEFRQKEKAFYDKYKN